MIKMNPLLANTPHHSLTDINNKQFKTQKCKLIQFGFYLIIISLVFSMFSAFCLPCLSRLSTIFYCRKCLLEKLLFGMIYGDNAGA